MHPLSQAKLKQFSALQAAKNRKEEGLFVAEGLKLTHEALASGWPVAAIVVQEATLDSLAGVIRQCQQRDIPLYICDERMMGKLSSQVTPEGAVAICQLPQQPPALPSPLGPAFVLNRIQDPGNLGTILRTAAWFGHRALFCSADTVDCFNPKVVRASMGAIFRVPVHYLPDFSGFVQAHAEQLAAAVMQGPTPATVVGKRNLLLMGSESHGLPPELLATPGLATVSIPGAAAQPMESLNVGIAAGILAYALQQAVSAS